MIDDVYCPYCGKPQEVCHDDGQGYEEDVLHEQSCDDCGKYFTFTTSISFSYNAYKADCLNGGEHEMVPVSHFPPHWPDWVRCKNCGYEVKGDFVEVS